MKKRYLALMIIIAMHYSAFSQEIFLKDEYKNTISNEPVLKEIDILRTINKWHYEMFPGNGQATNPFTLACLLDPTAYKLADSLHHEFSKKPSSLSKSAVINGWMIKNLLHTQGSGIFSTLPGQDPWGIMENSSRPTYKKLLPAEMQAMSIYSGKIMGKCYTLANLMTSLMVLLGTNPDDIAILQIWVGNYQHAIALAVFKDELILFNNESAKLADLSTQQWIRQQNCFGFFNHAVTEAVSFQIKSDFFSREETIIERVAKSANLTTNILDKSIDPLYGFKGRDDLVSKIFPNPEKSELYALTKYSYQSLYVKMPEMYLKASLRSSRPKELAYTLKSETAIFSWIKANIRPGSIFIDAPERIMTAEQVIVFKKGGLKDQAVLAFTLLKHNGFKPIIKITRDNAYITFENGKIFQAATWEPANSIDGTVEMQLSLDFPSNTKDETPDIPLFFELEQNYPNPFNRFTWFKYHLTTDTNASLKIFNLPGQQIKTIFDGHHLAGTKQVYWDGTDDAGSLVSSGIYLSILKAGEQEKSRKLLFIK